MSIFRIYVDGKLFYHPGMSYHAITQAKLNESIEEIDTLTLSAPFHHPYKDNIRPMASTIVCKKGESIVFEGRALDDGTDFYNTHTWKCESCLAYLNDTVQAPFDYSGTLRGLLEYFVAQHNEKVEDRKKFTVGTVTVEDDFVHYSNSEYSCTMYALRDKLIKTHGGYLQVRYVGSAKYLDYLSAFNTRSLQTVEYGKNLLDVKIGRDHTDRISALIPLGAKKSEDSEERVDICPVNDDVNFIFDQNAVDEIGWVWRTELWEDVTLPANLLRKAQARLSELVSGVTGMELSIVDESDAGADVGSIHARQYIDCKSAPHGINGTFLCVSKSVDYLNPGSSTITVGASGVKLSRATAVQDRNITAIEDDVAGYNGKISSASAKADAASTAASEAKEAADTALETAEGFATDISDLQVSVRECSSEVTRSSAEIMAAVHETYVLKDELAAVQQDFQTSITQNSSEIRMDFTAVTDEIRGEVAANQELLNEYIRFKGALIELGKVGNAFTAELSNEQLAFKENGQVIAYISNQSLVITNTEIKNKLSLGNDERGWFDFIPRTTGNLSIVWRGPST